MILPVLEGPRTKIEAAAESGHSPDGVEILDASDSHAAVVAAVALVRSGKVSALMKGSLHTDELMEAVVEPALGLSVHPRTS